MRWTARSCALAGTLALVFAHCPRGSAFASVTVKPLVPRAPSVAGAHGPAAYPDPRLKAFAEHIAQRQHRWQSIPDLLSRPGVDWSPHADRRVNWRRPTRKLEHSHKASIDAASSGAQTLDEDGLFPDTMRIAFIRIDFKKDRGGDASTGDGKFDLSRPGDAAPPIDRAPHNRDFFDAHLKALARYYDAQSYGRTVVVGEVWPRNPDGAYSCSDMADFGPWAFSQDIYGAAVDVFRAMLFAADTQSVQLGDRIPWQNIDRVVLIHAGGDLQSDVRQDSPEDIPSFTIGVSDTDGVIFSDSLQWNKDRPIEHAAIIPETITQDGFYGAINGVLAHECGHLLFGFVDLYDVETGLPTVGLWSLMDSGNLAGSIVVLPDQTELFATGMLPPSIDPWQRAFTTDSLPFAEVDYGDTLRLRSGERHPDMRSVRLSSDEYLILENRYLAPQDSVQLDQDDGTHVVLGPKRPDRFEYDALLPGGGILVWHIDESVIPNEFVAPCDSARANYGCGFNTNPFRLAISVIEADALADLGDPNSPYILGAPRDPYYHSNNPMLSDTTKPNLIPHIGTHPHVSIAFLDEPDSVMRVLPQRTWQLPGWPIAVPFPPGGPELTAIDLNGDGHPEVCWAGGRVGFADSSMVFAVQANTEGVFGPSPLFSVALDKRPMPVMAALLRSDALVGPIGALCVTTVPDVPEAVGAGGQVWLIDHDGEPYAGWPVTLPAVATTPPVVATGAADTTVYVGAADGNVYALTLSGTVRTATSMALAGGIRGRLAVYSQATPGNSFPRAIAAGGGAGDVVVLDDSGTLANAGGWPQRIGPSGFTPDFLWIGFGGPGTGGGDCFSGRFSLVTHYADKMWAHCLDGEAIPGWGRSLGDTLVNGLAAGDADGDGFAEVLTQSVTSKVSFWNLSGYPSPGWPKAGTKEHFRSGAPPVAADLDGRGGSEVVALNASGIVDALKSDGGTLPGWPLATGIGAMGSPLLVDLTGDGTLDLVAADARRGLFAYSLPTPTGAAARVAWPMLGGDPARSSSLAAALTPTPPPPTAGPLIAGSLKAYPNPARRRPVNFAYTLTEPGNVEFHITDSSGHEVASFLRRARQSDNVEVWDPGSLPAGLYLARLRFWGNTSDVVKILPVGIIK